MKKIIITEDERYPFYNFKGINEVDESDDLDNLKSIEIPEEKFQWLKSAEEAFNEAQDYLKKLVK